ncbi:MAG: 3-hydroxyacyl-ACP dehydratase FabZ [Lentisphaerota bacterium]
MTSALYDRSTIEEILPHRPPFLFVDRVVQLTSGERIVAELDLRSSEPHFTGHFPGQPIMPGVLIAEALAQTAGLLLGLSARTGNPVTATTPTFVMLASVDVKFLKPAFPGETLTLRASLNRSLSSLSQLLVSASVGRREIASGTIVLAEKKRSA